MMRLGRRVSYVTRACPVRDGHWLEGEQMRVRRKGSSAIEPEVELVDSATAQDQPTGDERPEARPDERERDRQLDELRRAERDAEEVLERRRAKREATERARLQSKIAALERAVEAARVQADEDRAHIRKQAEAWVERTRREMDERETAAAQR